VIDSDLLQDETPPGGGKKRTAARVLVAVFLGASLLIAGAGGYFLWAMGGGGDGKPVRVIVPPGSSASQIAGLLAERDVVRSAFVFRLVARMRGAALSLQPGAYDLRTGLGVSGALEALKKGIPLKVSRFTVPEGKNVFDIARIVGDKTHISEEAFLAAVRSGKHKSAFLPTGSTNLEGLLWPDTYLIDEKQTADDVVERMLSEFERALERAEIDLSRAKEFGLTPYEALVMASLIEREASNEKDRPLVASVIYNRLRRGMRLEIDATVQYAIVLQTGRYKGTALTRDDYRSVRSPYNTYTNDGLPPTPIASPGIASVRAVLKPATTNFIFYRLCEDDRPSLGHVFAPTIGERNRKAAACP